MSDLKVNTTNDNTAVYTTGAAAGGAIAGGTAGYFIKHYLKNGELSDKFVKSAAQRFASEIEKIMQDKPEELNKAKEYISNLFSNAFTEIKNDPATNLEEVFPEALKKQFASYLEKTINVDKKIILEDIKNLKTMGDFIGYLETSAPEKMSKLLFPQAIITDHWDSAKKQFVNCEEGLGKNIKDLAKRTQLKMAGIYAAAGAVALGLGAYFLTAKNGDTTAAKQNANIASPCSQSINPQLDAMKKTMAQSTTKTDTK